MVSKDGMDPLYTKAELDSNGGKGSGLAFSGRRPLSLWAAPDVSSNGGAQGCDKESFGGEEGILRTHKLSKQRRGWVQGVHYCR